MPELPEVEVVRLGLAPALASATVVAAEVRDPRALKRHLPTSGDAGIGRHGVALDPVAATGRSADFERRITGALLSAPLRRGKFLWIPMRSAAAEASGNPAGEALLAHLGMSGQLLLRSHEAPDDRHVRIRLWIEHPQVGELRIDFADQRLFGSLAIDRMVWLDGDAIPSQATHIARDPLDPKFDDETAIAKLRSRGIAVKSALLDQTLVSGVGNIYADEALWRVRLHPETPGRAVSVRKARDLLTALREVFANALAEGGTSFDAQYVNVNGEAGYFAHSLNAYGRTGEPCYRCDTGIKRIAQAGRGSHFCPRCQRRR